VAPTIILVHGLWMTGFQLGFLKRRLESIAPYSVIPFSYPTVKDSMADHVRRLLEFARNHQADELHFVGHSLGSLVILRALQLTDDLPPGRAVLLGPPCQGSLSAKGVARLPFGRAILGAALREECIEWTPREWSGRREVGIVAGSNRIGLGRLFADLSGDHDGTVCVEETKLPGAKDHIVLHTSHTQMLFSPEVAKQAVAFLKSGSFVRSSNAPFDTLRTNGERQGALRQAQGERKK
jgi:pimeloyl-ACP methyl ester carboxylesterase